MRKNKTKFSVEKRRSFRVDVRCDPLSSEILGLHSQSSESKSQNNNKSTRRVFLFLYAKNDFFSQTLLRHGLDYGDKTDIGDYASFINL